METPTPKNALVFPPDGNEHHKHLLRQIALQWKPATPQEAQRCVEECLCRAQSIASIFAQYCWGNRVDEEDLKFGLELLDDLLFVGYAMLEWLDEDRLIELGWTPPKAEEVQP